LLGSCDLRAKGLGRAVVRGDPSVGRIEGGLEL
jgi:hypothetical protein